METIATGGDWTDTEIARFLRREAALIREGLDADGAERLAQQMLYRDRPESGDDRRVCFECAHLDGRVCRSDAREAMHVVTRGAFEPVRTILQRCEGFKLKGKT